MSDQIKVPTCKHYDMTVAELEADGYAMEDMPLCEMCSYDEIERLQAELEDVTKKNGVLADTFTELQHRCDKENARLRDALEKTRRANHHFEIAEKNWTDENARLREALEKAQGELINLQPHIPQACKPGHESFIDTYVDKALLVIEEALKEKLT